ncbi:unnamed protein product [Didymodactylos carnosus]|uniref:Uncharacterized protein n=1 Tax=Didymodactylos carnosus TaxID=1234261 RepID=A0A814T1X6_9BILA|nr:unnamed protein product [Didymodactylos carnosus]CAF1156944.1 unnamed protein product [Didymodactylos carnosus]CAF3917041.1 unnamed protein product [Didymodactylos carnosus]CAF3968527.1 unnamed protein product [Didymodactylos carnosus]
MASARGSRRSSYSDSGISSTTTSNAVNPRYACYWLKSCRGQHELDDCHARRGELHGKLGIYYSSNGIYQRYLRDQINNLSLEHNPTGCTMINLLIYTQREGEILILFVTKLVKEKHHEIPTTVERRALLTLPSSYPREKGELQKQVAERALDSVTHEKEITSNLRSRLTRFLFVDASVIYPLHLTNEHADLLTRSFTPNDEISALHWFALSAVLAQLPEWNNYLGREAVGKELAQIRHISHAGIKLGEGYVLWSVVATVLMCIRQHVGFETFLEL